ncbi:MAG: Fic family protein [Propionibacteriaceae bacterium]|nr:Fic family protein [Propionibacteriaceae bacterium]
MFDWTGELRTIEISKGNTRFAFSQYLDTLGSDIFAHLADEDWLRGLERSQLVERLAYYYSELNILHPFREGNGRTIRTLLSLTMATSSSSATRQHIGRGWDVPHA